MNSHEKLFNLSEDELVKFVNDCIQIRKNNFSFIKCFKNIEDQVEFIKKWFKYADYDLFLLSSGVIQISDWENIMDSCNFSNKYFIFRKAYITESSGRRKIDVNKSKYDALIRVYGNNYGVKINLLIDNNKIFESDINSSNWSNENAGFLWNTHLE